MNQSNHFDFLILGAGPAGLQLGYYFQKENVNFMILEKGETPGNFFRHFPRHRNLISVNKVYTGYDDPKINLRWDWNSLLTDDDRFSFKNYSQDYFPKADALVEYLEDFADHYQLPISYNTEVVSISKKGGLFLVKDKNNNLYTAKRLIMATGTFKPYIPKIEGAELVSENYTNMSTDPMDYCGQRVLIFGKGNSAFETADNLMSTTALIHLASPSPVKMAWRTHYVGHLRAVNNNFLDTYMLKSQNALINGNISKIEKIGDKYRVTIGYSFASEEVEQLEYDRIIFSTGFQFDDSIFDETCKPAMTINNRFPAQTSEWESVNIKDLYFAGVLMHMRDFKKKQSGFIHGFRYNITALSKIINQKYYGEPLPFESLPLTAKAITNKIIERVNSSSSLWQQTGFLADLIVIDSDRQEALYYNSLPVDYVKDSELGQNKSWYLITLEFGQEIFDKSFDIFAIDRIHKDDSSNANQSPGLHPIIRGYAKNMMLTEHHLIEDFASEWKEEVHVMPLQKYFDEELAKHKFTVRKAVLV